MPSYCLNCGATIATGAKFCAQCGAAVSVATAYTSDTIRVGAPTLNQPDPAAQPPVQPPPSSSSSSSSQPYSLPPSPISAPLQVGQEFRHYTIIKLLGEGGMGAVYLANDHNALDQLVVIKQVKEFIDPSKPQQMQFAQERLEREARVLTTLKHTSIPRVLAFFTEGLTNYLVMEYVEGVSLVERLSHTDETATKRKGRPYTRADVLRWGIHLCKILEYLATRRPEPVVHRDIKPANIILDAHSGEVRIVDFGIAKSHRSSQSTKYLTPGYAPPEQLSGNVEPRSDVYALAATLYHLITDDSPIDHPFVFPKLERLGELGTILGEALVFDASQRPTALELRLRLETLVTHPSEFHAPTNPLAVQELRMPVLTAENIASIGCIHVLEGHTKAVNTIVFSPSGRLIATGSDDGTVMLWRVSDGTLLGTLECEQGEVKSIDFSPDGSFLAVGLSSNVVQIWQVAHGILHLTLEGHSKPVQCVAFSPDGRTLATSSSDRTIRLWNAVEGIPLLLFKGLGNEIKGIRFTPDGQTFVSVSDGFLSGTLRRWDAKEGELLSVMKVQTGDVKGIALAPNGDMAAVAGGVSNGSLRLWNICDRTPLHPLYGHEGVVRGVSFSPDSVLLASGAEDGTIKVWDVNGGTLLHSVGDRSTKGVVDVEFSPDGTTIASASKDLLIRIWQTEEIE
jgi:WD40 repeat protein